jgi:hypothetical protein
MYFEILTAAGGYRANIKGDNHGLLFQTEHFEGRGRERHRRGQEGRGRRPGMGRDVAAPVAAEPCPVGHLDRAAAPPARERAVSPRVRTLEADVSAYLSNRRGRPPSGAGARYP